MKEKDAGISSLRVKDEFRHAEAQIKDDPFTASCGVRVSICARV